MRYLLPLLVLCLPCAADFSRTPVISLDGHQMLVNNQPLRGMFVMWHAGEVDDEHGEEFYRNEFRKMRTLGFTGVHFEIGWNSIEPEDGRFDFESHGFDKVITWAAEEGLWVAILLTPHYTPEWVFEKHGDVRMKAPDGKDANGSFLTFSPSSPAVDDQIRFQQTAIRHYEQFNNIIAFFLTNEQAYGSHWVDHSDWARESWVRWLGRDVDIPKSENDDLWGDWLLFRRQELNRYFSRLYDGAASARSRFIPLGHKFVFYNAFDAFAHQWGLHITPLQTKMDIAACDAYGSSRLMYAGQLHQHKPILLAETNFWHTPDGDGGAGMMARMLLDQYFHGVQVQTVYAWNNYHAEKFHYGLNHPDGTPLTGTLGASKAAEIVASISDNTGLLPAEAGMIVPVNAFSRHSDRHWIYQHPMEAVLGSLDKYGIRAHVVYSDDILPEDYPGRKGPAARLDGYRILCAVTDLGLDGETYESKALREWVRDGGVLFAESLNHGAPSWTGIDDKPITPESTYSSTGETKFWRVSGQKARIEVAGKLSTGIDRHKVIARWDGDDSPAILAVPHGRGWVVYAGTAVFGDMSDGGMQRLLWDVLAFAGYRPPVLPIGPTYLVMGDTLYIRAGSDWQGKARIPDGFTVESVTQYDVNAEDMSPTMRSEDGWLKGSLAKDEFCVVRVRRVMQPVR